MMEPWRSPTQNRSSFINNNFKNSLQLVSNYWTTKAQGIVSDDRLDPRSIRPIWIPSNKNRELEMEELR